MDNDFKERAEAQHACIRRFMAATGLGPVEWAQQGYAVAFDEVWKNAKDHTRKDVGVIYDLTLATSRKVNTIIG